MTFWIAQIIAAVICVISAYSYFKKSKDKFLYLQILANVLYLIQYALLGAWSGAVANMINTVKFISFRQDYVKEVRTPLKKTLIFAAISVVLGLLVFDGPLSLIPIITAVGITFAVAQDNPVVLRLSYTVANLLWIFFNFMSRAYVSAAYSAVEFVLSLAAVIMLIRGASKKGEDPPAEATEVSEE